MAQTTNEQRPRTFRQLQDALAVVRGLPPAYLSFADFSRRVDEELARQERATVVTVERVDYGEGE